MTVRMGSCRCGKVTFSVRGKPTRVGLCHCTDCRQESGSAFTYYAVWPRAAFDGTGETTAYHGRRTCSACGSPVFALDEAEAEIKLGSLHDAPTSLIPTYELWTKRRKPWLAPLPSADQFEEDRTR